jgi:hypothetical protein
MGRRLRHSLRADDIRRPLSGGVADPVVPDLSFDPKRGFLSTRNATLVPPNARLRLRGLSRRDIALRLRRGRLAIARSEQFFFQLRLLDGCDGGLVARRR